MIDAKKPEFMNYQERETIKRTNRSAEADKLLLRIIAHWHRQRKMPPFGIYAANWIEAQKRRQEKIDPGSTGPLKELQLLFPFDGELRIREGGSDFQWEREPGDDDDRDEEAT